ncbi:hypothetical protein AB0425_07820 [Actinosynnema sp. NPDC051121]
MRSLRRNVLTAGCLALVAAAVPAAGGGVAHAAAEDQQRRVVLYRTDEPERIGGLRVEACAEPSPQPDAIRLWVEALEPDEMGTDGCGVTEPPPLPARDRHASARWVEDLGRVDLGDVPLVVVTDMRLQSCIQHQALSLTVAEASGHEQCNGIALNVELPEGR